MVGPAAADAAGFQARFDTGFLVAGNVAALVGLIAAFALPSRPEPGTAHGLH